MLLAPNMLLMPEEKSETSHKALSPTCAHLSPCCHRRERSPHRGRTVVPGSQVCISGLCEGCRPGPRSSPLAARLGGGAVGCSWIRSTVVASS